MTAVHQFVQTPDGPFGILEDDAGTVIAAGWTQDPEELRGRIRAADRPAESLPGRVQAAPAVEAYYAGDFAAVAAVPVRHCGTELQLAGWEALRSIAPGQPLAYAEFAARLGRPRAIRAAADVCARNAIGLFTPCHRVLRTDGGLGGFAWGTELKGRLLERERSQG